MDAVIYARYSSHNQRDESIEDQVRVCSAEANRRGDKIVHIYADRARSGTDASRRREFLQMISDASESNWKRLYIYKQDRFARNRYDSAVYKAKLKKAGVQIITVMEPMSDGPEGILMETMLEGLAEYYSANLSENVKRGMEGNALKCKHNGANLFGYDLGSDGYYHINEKEAALVRKAFEMFESGSSTGDIVHAFASRRTRRGARWTNARICEMLRNEKYAGTYIFGGHRIENGMEAIVDKGTWERVNSRLGKRYKRSHRYALSGKLFDADGNRFVGTSGTSRSGKTYYYYKVMSTGESYPQDVVEDAVYDAVGAFLRSDSSIRDHIAEAVVAEAEKSNASNMELARSLRDRIDEIDREADNVVSMVAKTGASDRLAARLKDLESEKSDALAELHEFERGIPKITKKMMIAFMDAIMAKEAPAFVVDAFVWKVVVDKDDLTVTFNVSARGSKSDLGSDSLRFAHQKGDRPNESAGSGLERAVRTTTLWLPCPHLTRIARVYVGPCGFAVSVTLRRSPRKPRRSGSN